MAVKLDKKIILSLLITSVIIICEVLAVTLYGTTFLHSLMFEPNQVTEYDYKFANNDGMTGDYEGFVDGRGSEYFEIIPPYFENVNHGEVRDFKIRVTFPEKSDYAGSNEVKLGIRQIPKGGGLRARTSVAIKFVYFVLFPYKYMTSELKTPSMNLNEIVNFTINVRNLGEPVINFVYGDIEIYNLGSENEEFIKNIKTDQVLNLKPKESRQAIAVFNSQGLTPGYYKAIAKVHWDENSSIVESDFKIGTKYIEILDFTKQFNKEAINKMLINVESRWNTPIKDIYAQIEVYDLEKTKRFTGFKSFKADLTPWEKKELEAYFDTSGLNVSNYSMKLTLNYEGSTTIAEEIISVVDNTRTEVVEEIPGRFSLKSLAEASLGFMGNVNPLLLLMIILVIINLFLAGYLLLKNRKKKEQLPNEIIKIVKELSKTHSKKEIQKMLSKKGWSPSQVESILKELK